MRRVPINARIGLLLAALTLLCGCGNDKGSAVDVVVIGDPASLFDGGVRLSPAAQALRGAFAQGLVALDQQGQVVPGIADRWIVTDDGLSYIFRLSDGARLGNARIGAEQVRAALMQALSALRGTALGKDLSAIVEVRAMTGRVVEIRLSRPQPELLVLLAQPELGLSVKGKGAGPMALRRDGTVAYLNMLEPERRGLPAADDWQDRVQPVRLRSLGAEAAIERFNRGDTDVVLGGRLEQFPLADGAGLSRAAIRLDPAVGLFGLAAVHSDGFLGSAENREAISMAIDREALAGAMGLGGWSTTERLVPGGLADSPEVAPERWPNLALAERQAVASARVARWQNGKAAPAKLRIGLPNGPGSGRLFARIADDLGKIGLAAVRVGPAAPADLRLIDNVMRYPTAIWFFNQLSCGVLPGPCSKAADGLVAEALATADPTERSAILARAEEELASSHVFIPLGAPIRWSLVGGNATGFVANPFSVHPLMPMAVLPK